MLRTIKNILRFKLQATDGKIGHVEDFYFDDQLWAVRYLVADTGDWLPGRQVLLAPRSIESADGNDKRVHVNLTRDQIENSPSVQEHRPVSRQLQIQLADYFGWTPYWESPAAAPIAWFPETATSDENLKAAEMEKEDPHLRSIDEVLGYHIHARDGEIGHIEDFLVQDDDWSLKYAVVDTRNWLPAKKVLVAMTWIGEVDWAAGEVKVDLQKDKIKHAPEFDPDEPVDEEYESALCNYYGESLSNR
ncbi:MAG: PRC-barrel domain-containing protein [Phycisphaerae bacterium]